KRGAELFKSAVLDLAYAFLRDAEAFAERFERGALLAQAALADDLQFALVERPQRSVEPARTALEIDGLADDLVGERRVGNEKILAIGSVSAFVGERGVERGVGA